MIRKSFIFLDGIGKTFEKKLWKQGIRDWDTFIRRKKIKGIGDSRKAYLSRKLKRAKKELYELNSSYFLDKLPQSETWRLYDFFRDETIFIDIEVTGVSKDDYITVIGLFNGIDSKIMIKDINFDLEQLKEELKKYKLIVTFNGSTFDIPFLSKRHEILPDIPNFDIRAICNRLKIKGRLKEIEKLFGLKRRKIIKKLSNGDPLCLYRMYRASGDEHYLKLLKEYNEEDVINLKLIADKLTKELIDSTI